MNTAPKITLTKTVTTTPMVVGVANSYVLTVTNTGGTANSAAVVISDTIPSSLTIGTLPLGCVADTVDTQKVICTVDAGDLEATTGSASFTIPVTPTAAASPAVTNTATATGGGDPTCTAEADCTSTTATPVNTAPKITLTKTVTTESGSVSGVAEAGETLTYTITLANSGGTAASYDLSDVLSAGLTYVSSTPTGTNVGQTTSWTDLTVPANDTLLVSVTATVDSPITGTSVSNAAYPTGGTAPDCTVTPTPAGCVSTPTAGAVTLSKALTSESMPFTAGQSVTYTVTLVSSGGTAVTDYSFTDTPSAGLTVTGIALSSGTTTAEGACAESTMVAPSWTCSGITVPAGATLVYTVSAQVESPLMHASVSNGAVAGAGPADCTSTPQVGSCVTTPTAGAVTLAKALATGVSTPFAAGQSVSYTVTLVNSGGAAVTNYSFTDTPSAGLTVTGIALSSGTSTAAGTCVTATAPDPSWHCTGITVPAGGKLVYTVAATVDNPITVTSVSNGAVAGDGPADCTNDPQVGSCVTTPTAGAVMLAKRLANGVTTPFVAGQAVAYTVTLTNSGGAAVANYSFTDTPSAGLTVTGIALSSGTTAAAGTCAAATASDPSWHCSGITVPANTTLIYTVTAQVESPVTHTNVSNGAVAGAGPADCESDPQVGSCVSTPTAGAVTLAKALTSVNGQAATRGQMVTGGDALLYTIQATNRSGTGVSDYVLVESIPVGLTVTGISGGTHACKLPLKGAATCSIKLASIPAGGSADVLVSATVDTPVTVASIANIVYRDGAGQPDCSSTPTPPYCVVNPAAMPGLTILKTVTSTGPYGVGSVITYGFKVTNTGNVTLSGVTVVDELAGASVSGGPIDLAPGAVDSSTFKASYTVTQADVNAGKVHNVATAQGVPAGADPARPLVSEPSEIDTPVTRPTTVTPIPTLGQYALLLLIVLMGAAVNYRERRRR